ncbi:non-heme halogenase [Moniliophthora roreri]|uniref:Putative halogenase n=1 Tax=Moniliophthora roreri TaxID=221103 RepID=A0A0W0G3R2_MONRR|nr:non-heme halogenase [Moniliophthora roreri]
MSSPPSHASILIIGGAPGGSYAASALQREGQQVVVLESAKFPRYHIGESMLPSARNYLRFIGLEEKFSNYGFTPKPGANFQLVHGVDPTYTDFVFYGPGYSSFNVVRAEADNLMLRHAEEQGAQVFEETRVDTIDFEGDPQSSRPIAANWTRKDGTKGRTTFDWLVDASGRAGIMSTKYLNNREMRESLRNIAVWGYWVNCSIFAKGTPRAYSPWFEALTDGQGWAWYIPLHDGTMSIGVVMHQNYSNAKKAILKPDGTKPTLTEHYLDQFQYVPNLKSYIGDGTLVPDSVKSASDYSYFAHSYAGDHFRIIGDAANFVDPFFSSGIHIAMTGGLSAAATICSSIRGDVDEKLAAEWHDTKVGIAHTRFLFVVLAAYQQMNLQQRPILSDISADNFDGAFKIFQPVIYGLADSQYKLTDDNVQKMMDTIQTVFDPYIRDKDVGEVVGRYGKDIVNRELPVLGPDKIKKMTGEDDRGRRIIEKFDVLKLFKHDLESENLAYDPILGYRAHVERGKLGLVKAEGE